MPHGKYAKCPNCEKEALGEEEIEKLFGYRQMDPKDPNSIIPQSHCKECRGKKQK